APDHHILESWNDFEPKQNMFSLAQPAISPIFNTRQVQESLLSWMGASDTSYYNYLQNRWRTNHLGQQQEITDFQQFWDAVLYTGVFVPGRPVNLNPNIDEIYTTAQTVENTGEAAVFSGNAGSDIQKVNQAYKSTPEEIELVI